MNLYDVHLLAKYYSFYLVEGYMSTALPAHQLLFNFYYWKVFIFLQLLGDNKFC